VQIGATSFVFRYLLGGEDKSSALLMLPHRLRDLGITRFQVCENAEPLRLALEEWDRFNADCQSHGIELHLGCKTLNPRVLEKYMARAARISSGTVRVVLEDDEKSVDSDTVRIFLKEAVGMSSEYDVRIAIENHFDIPVKQLVQWVREFPSDKVGFCLDAANSLRRFERVEYVFESLALRAYCFHLKDYKVTGTNTGFTVAGAPLGQGDLDLEWVLDEIFSIDPDPEVYLETWVAPSGFLERDIASEWEWLVESVKALNVRLAQREEVAMKTGIS
jgi:sugar phosphate isomerase/epimerase